MFCIIIDRLLRVVLALREYSLKRTVDRGAKGAQKGDEKQGTLDPADATLHPTAADRSSVEGAVGLRYDTDLPWSLTA